ncbi:MAG: hypothetical protein D4R77_09775 [Planctomycetaceae bacterium]|jgi:hypothetical protein|nr:MAG: hypothetical protein DWH80_13330 [Planctomycetota bacterium]TSA04432.1 MAG: hypothetical protein D4R77_09775 [Planctomycetaceae bacterium]
MKRRFLNTQKQPAGQFEDRGSMDARCDFVPDCFGKFFENVEGEFLTCISRYTPTEYHFCNSTRPIAPENGSGSLPPWDVNRFGGLFETTGQSVSVSHEGFLEAD